VPLRSLVAGATLAALMAARPAPVIAQDVSTASVPAVTAAFLVNFARFTEWPPDALAPDAPLVMCVTDPAVATALTVATVNHPVDRHPVAVRIVRAEDDLARCTVLYASGLDARRLALILASVRSLSVLSVGDTEAFTHAGGVMYLYLEDGRMRFAVNVAAADRARLHFSAKLLKLARIVSE
jgi:hypothetical protein